MKKRFITLLSFSLIAVNSVFADYAFVDSSDFTGDAFFTPPALQEKQEMEAKKAGKMGVSHSLPPLKKLRLKVKKKLNEREAKKYELAPTAPEEDVYAAEVETSEYASRDIVDDFDDEVMNEDFETEEDLSVEKPKKKSFFRKKSKEETKAQAQEEDNIILDCKNVDYDTENYCVIATGDAVVEFVKQGIILKADKIVYDRLNNTVKADGNVQIVKNGQTVNGEYIFVDMNEENALIEKPIIQNSTIMIKSDKGYVYGDKIVQEKGELDVTNSFPINFKSLRTGPNISKMMTPKYETLSDDLEDGRIKIKVKDIKIAQRGDLEVISLKNTSIFRGDKKIIKLPPAKIYTNKNFDFADTSSWEIGSFRGLGAYIGPGHVFEIPGGSILKVMPILNYKSELGIGGIVRFMNASNWTQASYGTANDTIMVRGTQKLDDQLTLEYVMNDYAREWFLGRRRAKYGAALVYQNGYSSRDFLLKGQVSSFAHRFDAGFYQDFDHDKSYRELGGTELATTRTRYMAQANQTFFTRRNEEKQREISLHAVAQMSAALYGTGDTQVLGRLGPMLHIQNGRWMQDIGYFQSAYEDNSPMPVFDAYRYGKSNFYLREYIRLNRYITLSWFGSFNLSNDSPNHRQIQENTFFVTFGPDDIKFSLGYDVERDRTRFLVEVMMDAKGTHVEYDKLEIKQDKKAKKKDEIKEEDDSDFQKPNKAPVLQHAVVEDVKTIEDVI